MMIARKAIIINFVFLCSLAQAFISQDKGVVGKDTRVISNDSKIGRLHFDNGAPGCTASLISKSCAITAGHCRDTFYTLKFNIPVVGVIGIDDAKRRDTYQVDRNSIVAQNESSTDEDWAVFRVKKHKKISSLERWWASHFEKNSNIGSYPKDRGYYPGEMQGYYTLSFDANRAGTEVAVTGYGSDKVSRLDAIQRTANGVLLSKHMPFSPFSIFHDTDTTPGDSGAPIIDLSKNQIIAVHTAFIYTDKQKKVGFNAGTSIHLTKRFQDAIRDCIKNEGP